MALNTGDKNAKVTILLVTKTNEMIVDRLEVHLKDGLLPVRDIKKKWNAKVCHHRTVQSSCHFHHNFDACF